MARTPTSSAGRADAGVSLLELIIVLAVIGLTATLGVGAALNWLERSRMETAVAALETAAGAARYSALLHQDHYDFHLEPEPGFISRSNGRRVTIDLPETWRLTAEGELAFAGPTCTPGALVADHDGGRSVRLSVEPPACEVRAAPAVSG